MLALRRSALVLLVCASACDPVRTPPDDAGIQADSGPLPDAGMQVGDLESFATLSANSEGIAFGVDATGQPTLYVGVLGAGEVVAIGVDGAVSPFVSLPRPLGIAARANGDLVVCGRAGAGADSPGVLYDVTPAGDVTTLLAEGPGGSPLAVPNYVAIAPDDSLVFSDSDADLLYRADADGSNIALLSDSISYPNGLAFSADGETLYVASWDTATIFALSFDRASGAYGSPTSFRSDADNVDGIVTLASGALLFVTSSVGVVRAVEGETPMELLPSRALSLPANGSAGVGAYGEQWLYLTSLGNSEVWRLRVGEPAVSLPAR